MSFRPGPHHYGIVLPQDPDTGVLGRPWVADGVRDIQVERPGEVVRHPVETSPNGPTDVVLREVPTISATFMLSNAYTPLHPRPDLVGPDRALRQRDELVALAERGEPVAILLRGDGLVRNRLIGNVSESRPLDSETIEITVVFGQWDPVTLEKTAIQQDADLIALGGSIVSGGQL